jgi:hypothetical protein
MGTDARGWMEGKETWNQGFPCPEHKCRDNIIETEGIHKDGGWSGIILVQCINGTTIDGYM